MEMHYYIKHEVPCRSCANREFSVATSYGVGGVIGSIVPLTNSPFYSNDVLSLIR